MWYWVRFSQQYGGGMGWYHAFILMRSFKKWPLYDLLLAEPEMRMRAQFLIPNIEIEQHAAFAIGIGGEHV